MFGQDRNQLRQMYIDAWRKHQAGEVMRRVAVLPAGEHHAAVVHHGGTPVVILVEAEAADAGAVGVHDVQVGDLVVAAHARHALEAGGRVVDDPLVG